MGFLAARIEGFAAPPEQGLRYYGLSGVGVNARDFVSADAESIPHDALEVRVGPGSIAAILARRLRVEHQLTHPSSLDGAGKVFHHSDGGRVHSGICVGTLGPDLMLLFMTTSPNWNPLCRRMTREEQVMIGFPIRRITYLAPVLRPDGVTWSGSEIPDHRTSALRREFFTMESVEAIRLL